jgi:hypothetical protein
MRRLVAAIIRPSSALIAALVLGMAAALLAACQARPPAESESYFPLAAGHRWVYDVKTEWENNVVEHETRVMSTHGLETLNDVDGGQAWRRRSDSGLDYWLRSDDSGIARIASKNDLQAEPLRDKAPRHVLKKPYVVGTTWASTTTAYLLHRRQEFPREIKHTHPEVPMTYTIDAVDESRTTRAGRFDKCLRVTGRAVLRLYADPVVGWRDLPITTREWYCQGVGLVRLERDEPAQSTFLGGGALSMELMEWR